MEMLKGSFKGILTKSIDQEKIKEPFHSMVYIILIIKIVERNTSIP